MISANNRIVLKSFTRLSSSSSLSSCSSSLLSLSCAESTSSSSVLFLCRSIRRSFASKAVRTQKHPRVYLDPNAPKRVPKGPEKKPSTKPRKIDPFIGNREGLSLEERVELDRRRDREGIPPKTRAVLKERWNTRLVRASGPVPRLTREIVYPQGVNPSKDQHGNPSPPKKITLQRRIMEFLTSSGTPQVRGAIYSKIRADLENEHKAKGTVLPALKAPYLRKPTVAFAPDGERVPYIWTFGQIKHALRHMVRDNRIQVKPQVGSKKYVYSLRPTRAEIKAKRKANWEKRQQTLAAGNTSTEENQTTSAEGVNPVPESSSRAASASTGTQ